LVTEDRKRLGLFSEMTVGENVTICALAEAAAAGVIKPRSERRLAEDAIRKHGVKTSGTDSPITSLSGGNQQKAIIGRWLLTRPKVLLLDDPTRGVDVGAKADLYWLMDRLCRDGLGIIVTSSELPALLILCDRRLAGPNSRARCNPRTGADRVAGCVARPGRARHPGDEHPIVFDDRSSLFEPDGLR